MSNAVHQIAPPNQRGFIPKRMHIGLLNYRGLMEGPSFLSWIRLYMALGATAKDSMMCYTTHTVLSTGRQLIVDSALDDPECTHLLFIDDDMTFDFNHVSQLEKDMIHADLDFVCALAFSNSMPTKPCIFGQNPTVKEWSKESPWWVCITDYPKDQLFRIYAGGFGMAMMSTRMLRAMKGLGHNFFIDPDGATPNEDIAFCLNAHRLGFETWCDSRVSIGHVSKERPIITEQVYKDQGQALFYTMNVPMLPLHEGTCIVRMPEGEQQPPMQTPKFAEQGLVEEIGVPHG